MPKKKKKKGIFSRIIVRGTSDYALWVITFLLLSLGLIMVLSASSSTSLAETDGKTSFAYLKKQALAACAGLGGMLFFSIVNVKVYKHKLLSIIIYLSMTALMIYTGLHGFSAGGARRWLKMGPFGTFQPSEIAKFGYILVYAHYLSYVKESGKMKKWWHGTILPIFLLIPIVAAIYKLQNHLSATILISVTSIIQIWVASEGVIGAIAIGRMASVMSMLICAYMGIEKVRNPNKTSFRGDRIAIWRNPESDPTGKGWQILQSMYTIASGGLFGVGLGNSKQKHLYLPEPQNDFIFAVLAEELGFVGCMAVILLFALFIWRGIAIARKTKDTYSCLIAIGITVIIGLQAILNIAVVTNSMPVTGIPLPFFSYGGTALAVDLCAVGILQSIARSNNKIEE